jgi:hypothetical protein
VPSAYRVYKRVEATMGNGAIGLAASAFLAGVVLSACLDDGESPERTAVRQAVEAESVSDAGLPPSDGGVAPVDASPAFETSESIPPEGKAVTPADPMAEIEARLSYLGADKTLVVRATVEGEEASVRKVPLALKWDPGFEALPRIVTSMTLTILEFYCGTVESGPLVANYFGGVLPTGEDEIDSKLTPILKDGEEYIFILRTEDGERWLQGGNGERLKSDLDGHFRWRGMPIEADALKGVCP